MPISAAEVPKFSATLPSYFPSLSALDDHVAQPKRQSTINILPYVPKSVKENSRGKLLVSL